MLRRSHLRNIHMLRGGVNVTMLILQSVVLLCMHVHVHMIFGHDSDDDDDA